MAGVGLFPQTLTVAPASVVVGILIAKMGKYRWSVWSGWVLTTTGMGLLILLSPNTSTVGWIFLNLVSGLGLGILYPAISFSVQASASNADLPFAAAMYSFFRAFGQMLGVAIGGAVFQNEIKKKLLGYPELAAMATEYSRDSSALVQIIKGMPASQDLTKTHLIQAYVDSLRVVWIVMCALAGLALISSLLWVKDLSLERELETEQGFRHEVKVTDSELTLGNSVATTREKKLLANDSQMTLGNSSVTSEPSSVMERTIVWKPSEATLGNSSTRTETTPEPKDLVKKPSQMTLGASSTTTIPADTDRDTHITAAAPAVDTKDFTDVHIPRGSGNPQTPQKVKKPRKPKKPSLKQQRDELLDWLYND